MKNVNELKQSVSLRMKRCWGECCALFFISAGGIAAALFAGYIVVHFLVATGVAKEMNTLVLADVTATIIVLMWVITVPYRYGSRWYRLQQVRGHSVHAKSVFSCYFSSKRLFQVYKLSIMLMLKRSVLLLPFMLLLGTAVYLIIKVNAYDGGFLYNLAVVVLLMLSVALYLAYTIINIKYVAAPYIFVLGYDRPTKDIINDSVRFSKGMHNYMIEVLRSCAIMLVPCILFFPMVFVAPKIMMIYTAAINEIIEHGFAEERLAFTERRD